jgi:hypothetical protein
LSSQKVVANRTEPESYQEFGTLPDRLLGVLRSPRAVFRSLIARPRWAGAMLTTYLLTAACGVALMQTAVGRQALVDQWERTALAFGREIGDEDYSRMVALSANGAAYAVVRAAAAGPVLTLAVAAAIVGMFNATSARRASYQQVLAIAAHAGAVLALGHVVTAPIAYATETLADPTTLGRVFPAFDEASPVARFLGAVDLFVVWWAIVLGIGVALLYRRPPLATIAGFVGIYVGFAAALAIAMAVTGGTL